MVKDEERELAVMQLSQILKDVLCDEYLPLPKGVKVADKDKQYFKDLAVYSLMIGMQELSKDLNLPKDLKSSLILCESDLERFCKHEK